MGAVISWVQKLFWSQEMEVAILGLANAGKTTFCQVIQNEKFDPNTLPTIGFSMKKIQKGKVTLKVWDMGGHKQFRGMWERYCRDVETIVFVVDSADLESIMVAKEELHRLMNHSAVAGIPLLVLLNKNDLPEAVAPQECVNLLELESILGREVAYYSISCLNRTNIDNSLQWLIDHSKKGGK